MATGTQEPSLIRPLACGPGPETGRQPHTRKEQHRGRHREDRELLARDTGRQRSREPGLTAPPGPPQRRATDRHQNRKARDSLSHQRIEEHVVRRFVGEIRIRPRQFLRFVARKRGGEHLRAMAQYRPRDPHAQAVAPEQRTRAAPAVFREPARPAAHGPSRGREIERRRGCRDHHGRGQPCAGSRESPRPSDPDSATCRQPQQGRPRSGERTSRPATALRSPEPASSTRRARVDARPKLRNEAISSQVAK